MTPFSLLPHWFQRRYRVWRCWRRAHRWEVRQTRRSGVTVQDGVPFAAGALVWTCVDCLRNELVGDVIPDASNHKARRDA